MHAVVPHPVLRYLHEGLEIPRDARQSVRQAVEYTDRDSRAVTLNLNAREV